MPRLLLTRPKVDAERFAASLGVGDAVISPLMEMRITGPLPALGAGLIFSSANGVAAYVTLGGPSGLAAWCVGARTAQAAGQAGLVVQATFSTAADLCEGTFPEIALTHLHGRHTRGDIAQNLVDRGYTCSAGAIYDQIEKSLTAEAIDCLTSTEETVVPLFSPRSAALFAAQCPASAWPKLQIVAISAATGSELPKEAHVVVAEAPDGPNMAKTVQSLLHLRKHG